MTNPQNENQMTDKIITMLENGVSVQVRDSKMGGIINLVKSSQVFKVEDGSVHAENTDDQSRNEKNIEIRDFSNTIKGAISIADVRRRVNSGEYVYVN